MLIRLVMLVVLLVAQQAPATDHVACAAFNPDCATAGDGSTEGTGNSSTSEDDERTAECESSDGEDSDEASLASHENVVAEFALAQTEATVTPPLSERARLLRPPRA